MSYFITKNRAACVIMQIDWLIIQVDLVQNVLLRKRSVKNYAHCKYM